MSRKTGITEEQLSDLSRFETSVHFDQDEKLVLRLAVALTRTPSNVSDDLFAGLRNRFSERELVELSAAIAWENYRARFNRTFDVGSEGFSQGKFCPLAGQGWERGKTMTAEQPRSPTSKPDVANLGLVRPPFVYLVSLLIGIGLDLVRPARWLRAKLGAWVGVPIMIAALALFFSSMRRFKAVGTPIPGNQPTTAIVKSGPYRFSRNPIYLAFSLLVLGVACALNSLWLVGTLAAAVSVMSFVVIPKEERYLECRFGAEYLDYRANVGRWL